MKTRYFTFLRCSVLLALAVLMVMPYISICFASETDEVEAPEENTSDAMSDIIIEESAESATEESSNTPTTSGNTEKRELIPGVDRPMTEDEWILSMVYQFRNSADLGGFARIKYDGSGKHIADVAMREYRYSYMCENTEQRSCDGSKYCSWFFGKSVDSSITEWDTLFITWCAEQLYLVYDGTFPYTNDRNELYNYLTDSKELDSFPAKQAAQLSHTGTHSAEVGDIIFLRESADDDVFSHVGIITGVGEDSIQITQGDIQNAINTVEYTRKSFKAYGKLKNSVIVHVVYPANEELIFNFCINELQITPAAACGILGNMVRESSHFDPGKVERGSQEGFGICQWSYERKAKYFEYADALYYNADSMRAQLLFFKHEIQQPGKYTLFTETLYGADNSKTAAYDVGLTMCLDFERPADRVNEAVIRATIARNVLYDEYVNA